MKGNGKKRKKSTIFKIFLIPLIFIMLLQSAITIGTLIVRRTAPTLEGYSSGMMNRLVENRKVILQNEMNQRWASVYARDEVMGGLLERQLGREPTVTEIASALGIEVEELSMAMEAGADVESLQQVIYQGDGTEITLMDKLENEDEPTGRMLDHMLLEELLGRLDAQEKQLILMRYYQEKTQSAIAEKLGISQVQVSRMEKRVLKKMREFS